MCCITAGLMIGAVLFVAQLFENEESVASTDPMVISDIKVFQDTMPVLKGTSLQLVLGIKLRSLGLNDL